MRGEGSCILRETKPLHEVCFVSRSHRPRCERTHDWRKIQQYTLWPEQQVYELLRPVVLFNESACAQDQWWLAQSQRLRHAHGSL